jgi:hypothetical protein
MADTALMPRNAGTGAFRKLWDKHTSLKTRVERLKDRSEGMVEGMIRTLEIQGAAFVFGAVQGAWFDPTDAKDKPGAHVFGLPMEAAAGIGLHLLGLMGIGGKYSGHLHNFGDGALAAYVSNIGRGWGYKWAKERKASGKSLPFSGASASGLRDEVAAILDE